MTYGLSPYIRQACFDFKKLGIIENSFDTNILQTLGNTDR